MQTIALGPGGRETTRLGFGCSSLMGSMGRQASLATLEAAFAAGIRHFDVAPSYGYGQAESCLGEFAARHPDLVTITTKYGIAHEGGDSIKSFIRGLGRPVLKLMPGLKARLQKASAPVTSKPLPKVPFSASAAKLSIENSLRALRVERVDVWLLHEAEAADLADDGLLRMIEELVATGKIGTFGVGSDADKIGALLATRASYCRVLQYGWSVLDPLIPQGTAFRIHHRALTQNFRALYETLSAEPARQKRWTEYCGVDLTARETVARLMLKASLLCNPQSLILFSSKRPEHIAANAGLLTGDTLDQAALRFYSLVRAEAQEVGVPA